MKKRGFTLIEMLAVVVILGIILVVAIPQIQNQLANKKDVVHEATLKIIYDATEEFVEAAPSTFQRNYKSDQEHSIYCIPLQDIVDAGKLEAPIKNFTNGEEIDLTNIVRAEVNQYNEFIYTLLDSSECEGASTELIFYKDATLKEGTYPNIYTGMIPVVYKNGSWVTVSKYEAWYNYQAGQNMWANVVTVNAHAADCGNDCLDHIQKHDRTYYQNHTGVKVSIDDINGMYVWIPRFEYKITVPYGVGIGALATSPGAIEINLVSKTTKKATSGYTIHPAFTYGTKELGGFWVAKFEASADPTSKCIESPSACDSSKIKVIVAPNRDSWRNITIGNAYTATSSMNGELFYGFKSSNGVHLMKNTEWGAVAYLSQSKYGKYGKDGQEVFPNMYYNNGTLTGCTSGKAGNGLKIMNKCTDAEGNKLNYNYEASYRGSTSGTIYGIFDMAGGAAEYVMGNYNRNESRGGILLNDIMEQKKDEAGELMFDEEGSPVMVIKTPRINDRYVNIYTTKTCANNECAGAALLKTEFASSIKTHNWWLDEYALNFSDDEKGTSWLVRGGDWSLTSQSIGIFAVRTATGLKDEKIGFRPVIAG